MIERLEFLGHNASLQLMQPYQKWIRCFKGGCQADPMVLVVDYLDTMKALMVPAVERENQSRYLWAHFNSTSISYNFGLFELANKYASCCRKMYEEHNFGARLKLFLVEAEFAVAIGDHRAAPSLYFSAILHMRQSGFIALEAMANERAGEYYFSRNEEDHASEHFQEAIRLYSVWGAHAKVNQLKAVTSKIIGHFPEQKVS